jgi:hypothetical protein
MGQLQKDVKSVLCITDVDDWTFEPFRYPAACCEGASFGIVKEDHLVTSKLFGTILYTIDPDPGG